MDQSHAFKFFNRRDVDRIFGDETLRLPSAREIRGVEGTGAGYGDDLEAAKLWVPGQSVVKITVGHPLTKLFPQAVGKTLEFEDPNQQLRFVGDAAIFSMSRRAGPALRERMKREFGYDGFFYIGDTHRLGHAICISLGIPKIHFCPVRYADLDPQTLPEGTGWDPGLKQTLFEWQEEVRFWWPIAKADDTRILHVPGLQGMIGQPQFF